MIVPTPDPAVPNASFMHHDRYGQPITAQSARAVELYDDAVDRMFALQPGSDVLIDEALALDPEFALGHCAKARTLAGLGDNSGARDSAARGRELTAHASERERRHAEIVFRVFRGDSGEALAAVQAHALDHPRDAVPISFALGVYGLYGFGGYNDFRARQVDLLERVAHAWGEDDWWFLASYGWALVELGDAERGIPLLDRALELKPDNANAAHGRTHGYYELGAAEDGEAFIEAWLPGYDRGAILHAHLAWHQALFALQRGDPERAHAIYVDSIRPAVSRTLPMFTMVDCASFLLRAEVAGMVVDPALRRELVELVEERFAKPGIPFVNAHIVMAYGGVSDRESQDRIQRGVAKLLEQERQPSGPVVASVCSAVAAYSKGDYLDAADTLVRALPNVERLGGSNAQRDVFIDLAVSAHVRCGAMDAARNLARERWTKRAGHLGEAWFERLCAVEN